MGSLRAKQASYIEVMKAISVGGLQGLTRRDRAMFDYIVESMHRYAAGSVDPNFEGYDADLKLYLPFDETSGATAHDLSGNGNTGTATGTTIVPGVFGKARSFNGSSDFIDCGSGSSIDITADLTLEAWINVHDYTVKNAVFNAGYNGAYLLDLYATAAPENRVILWHNSTIILDIGNALQPIDTWQHIAVTRSHTIDKKVRLYVNAVLKGTSAAYTTNPAAATQNLWIARYSSEYADMIIDEPRIYSRVLSVDEMYLHYLAGALKLGLI